MRRADGSAMRAVGVIQARMNSTRLPGKILMTLAGAALLQRLVERVKRSQRLDALVVATTTTPVDDRVADLCAAIDVPCFRGDESDVLQRVYSAARQFGADVLVRLTADNPFVDGALVDYVLDAYLAASPAVPYASNVEGCGFPYGLYVEVVSMEALAATLSSSDPMDREHVTWHMRQRPEKYRSLAVRAPGRFAYRELTIDTAEDYARVGAIFEDHFGRNPDFSFRDLMSDTVGGEQANAPGQI